MKQTVNALAPAAATDEPAVLSIALPPDHSAAPHLAAHDMLRAPVLSAPAISPAPTDHTESLIQSALHAGRDFLSGRPARQDGFTPDRIGTFLRVLAATGCVTESARAAGVTRQAAYALRASTKGRAFALAWDGAVRICRGRLADDLLARALNGNVETVYRDGAVVEQRHHHDNGLGLALLARLDRLADRADSSNAARYVADEFDQFVEIAAVGGEGAADFVASRCALGYRAHEEAQVLRRAENFAATGDGLPEGCEPDDSPAADLIRSLFAAVSDEDEEEELEDVDDDAEEEQDEGRPDDSEGEDEDADAPGRDLPDMALEEYLSDGLAGPSGTFLDDDDDENDAPRPHRANGDESRAEEPTGEAPGPGRAGEDGDAAGPAGPAHRADAGLAA